jgi:polysaccharide export outer membrane protein
MSNCKLLGRWSFFVWLLFAAFLFPGCETAKPDAHAAFASATPPAAGGSDAMLSDGGNTEMIHVGDSLVIVFSDLPQTVPNFEVRVDEGGSITLMLNEKFVAAGKTRGQLEKEIRERYVPRFFVRMTVTIKPQERMFYVDGEVRSPGPKLYMQPMTVLKSIASAGDFTDFAKRTKVTLTRLNGKKQTINCDKARRDPRLDVPVYPGDTIHVPRRYF